jgi:hypothetical protein
VSIFRHFRAKHAGEGEEIPPSKPVTESEDSDEESSDNTYTKLTIHSYWADGTDRVFDEIEDWHTIEDGTVEVNFISKGVRYCIGGYRYTIETNDL